MAGAGFSEAGRKVVGGQVVIAVSEAVRFALSLFLTATLGRHLLPAEFGFVTLVPAIYFVAHVVLDLGTGALIAREAARRPERERPLIEAALLVRGIGGGLLGLVVAGFAIAEPDPARRLWLFVTALSLPALAPAVIGSAFRVRQDQIAPAIIGFVTILVMIGATLLGVRMGAAGPTFAVIYVLREVVNGMALWIVGRARHGLTFKPGLAGRGAGAFFAAAVPQNVAVVFQVASLHVGLFGTRAFLSEADLGAYSAAWRLVGPLLLLMGALVAPLLPVLAQAFTKPDAFTRILSPALAIGGGTGILGIGFLLAVGGDALRLVYKSRFSEGPNDAGPALIWLGFVFGAVCVGAVATTALLCIDGERHLRGIAIMALILNVIAFSIALPILGRVAAATGLLAAEVWTATAALVVLRRRMGPLIGAPVVRTLAPVLLAVGAMLVLPSGPGPVVRVLAAGGCAAVGLLFLALGPGRALRTALHEPLA